MTQATLYHKQIALDGPKPSGPPRRPQDGVCVAPRGVECNLEYHPGKCKARPCKHCMTSCLYWRRGE